MSGIFENGFRLFYKRFVQDVQSDFFKTKILLISGSEMYDKRIVAENLLNFRNKNGALITYLNFRNPKLCIDLEDSPEGILKNLDGGKEGFLILDNIDRLKSPAVILKTISKSEKIKASIALTSRKIEEDIFSGISGLLFKDMVVIKFDDFFILTAKEGERRSKKDVLEEYLRFGSYPSVLSESSEQKKQELLNNFIFKFISYDVEREGIRNTERFLMMMKRLAENTGNLLNNRELSDYVGVSITAIENYLNILEKYFIIKRIKPFYGKFNKELKKMQKAYFLDSGLRNALLENFKSTDERMDRDACFENHIFNQIYSLYPVESIRFWRTQAKNEIDFVVKDEFVQFALDTRFYGRDFKSYKYSKFEEHYQEIELKTIDYSGFLKEGVL